MKLKFHWSLFVFFFAYLITGLTKEVGIFFVLISLHELMHSLMAIGYGFKVKEIILYPFGGRAKMEDLIEEDPKKELNIALAGPLFNIILAFILLSMYEKIPLIEETKLFIVRANLILAGFNLLPGLPLDGGRILRALLTKKYSFREASHYACQGGKIVGFVVLLFGAFLGGYWSYINLTFFLVGGFLIFASIREEQEIAYLYFRYLTRKRKLLYNEGVVGCDLLLAFEKTLIEDIIKLFGPKKYHTIKVIDDNWKHKGTVDENEVIDALFKKGTKTKISDIL
ncbi:M50 family metallopeptidase [Natranaerobius trueperi]|uniref:Peptidase M50 n=1 Tax=Natranaerobius trueperi TaxID=759412 RepID=A0A226BYB5_9FIRM|nr:M50 family metallopeptidase [Natranaerobius trueperi]OWZ83925.1 peptidase M50 [Natranaerobius trueperi]